MEYIEQAIKGVYVITPKRFGDDRGYFSETFKQDEFESIVGKINFIQDNESYSSNGVLRGIHFQYGEYAQAKLVRVVEGSVLDIAVDLRKDSETFGKYVAVELSEQNGKQLFIPRGFGHAFLVLSDTAKFIYKVDNVYAPEYEGSIIYNDKDINISWPKIEIKLSEKDKYGITLQEYTKKEI